MRLQKHARVHVGSLNRDGVILAEVRPGLYEVAVGSVVVRLKASDLSEAEEKAPEPTVSSRKRAAREKKSGSVKSAFIDLHGMKVEEAIQAVERKIDQALAADVDRLDVMHGIGSGKLKSALHRYFASLPVVKRYKISDDNPGLTWVFF